MSWRWDQGRLDYFEFANIRRIAGCLAQHDGITLKGDPLRLPLQAATRLPFPPRRYKVWRNFGRVFGASLLAVARDGQLVVTEICKSLSNAHGPQPLSADEYFTLLIQRFFYPFPAFEGYSASAQRTYPFAAILKLLVAKHLAGQGQAVTVDEAFGRLVGNGVTGSESLEMYSSLPLSNYVPRGDERRQLRELMIVLSQLSLLKWDRNHLFLDADPQDARASDALLKVAVPDERTPLEDRAEQLLRMGRLDIATYTGLPLAEREIPLDTIFTEGKRVRVSHLRVERSPLLRQMLMSRLRRPVCDMCRTDTHEKYPWTENILEVHHLLPLAASIRITTKGTSLDDVKPLCPSCHKSVHVYYSKYLQEKGLEDFESCREAKRAYCRAKSGVAA